MAQADSIPERACYHAQPEANRMGDPNGPIQWQGRYHLFFQYYPYSLVSGPMHWGHMVSHDLVAWTNLPVALTPTPDSPDADGCWSGCAVDNMGVPTLVYTGVLRDRGFQGGFRESVCLATSTDDLRTWQKSCLNPVIAGPPPSYDVRLSGFRDPCIWHEDGAWSLIIGSGVQGVGGSILLYRSPDLLHWDYIGPLYERSRALTDPVWTGSMWECPQFFALGDRHVLLFGVWDRRKLHYVVSMTGEYSGGRFTPVEMRRLDLGPEYYAPSSMLADDGRRLVWGWIREARSRPLQKEAGWTGMMSLPRVLTMRADGLLDIVPLPELASLRGSPCRWTDLLLTPTSSNVLREVRGDCLEFLMKLELGPATSVGLKLRRSASDEEFTLVWYDGATGTLVVNRDHASQRPGNDRGMHGGPIPRGEGESLALHVFLDRTIVEVYANGCACLTERIYPSRPDSLGTELFVAGGTAMATEISVWELAPARRRETH